MKEYVTLVSISAWMAAKQPKKNALKMMSPLPKRIPNMSFSLMWSCSHLYNHFPTHNYLPIPSNYAFENSQKSPIPYDTPSVEHDGIQLQHAKSSHLCSNLSWWHRILPPPLWTTTSESSPNFQTPANTNKLRHNHQTSYQSPPDPLWSCLTYLRIHWPHPMDVWPQMWDLSSTPFKSRFN